MDQIFIRDLVVYGILGVHEWERQRPREIIINLSIFTDLQMPGKSDDIRDTIDYSTVADKVRKLVETTDHRTVEGLAQAIAELCLEMPNIVKVQINLEKPGAVQFARTVGVAIERDRGK